jgi:CHAT domain-containing protein
VQLTKAQLDYDESNYEAASRAASHAEAPLVAAGSWRRVLLARWLQGESARALGLVDKSRKILETTLRDAELYAQPQAAQRSLTSLGLLAAASGDARSAEASFKRAIALIEDLRAPLPAEEFRTAFFADKLVPYDEMVRLCLTDKTKDRTIDALGYVERARSRALVDMLGGALKFDSQPHDSYEAQQLARLDELRAELNWFYNQLNRPLASDAARTVIETAALHEAIRERESETLELMRQLQHLGGQTTFHVGANVEGLDVAELQRDLGTDSALIEYTSLDGELLAFIVTNEGVECVRGLGNEAEVTMLLEQFRFQISSLRYGAERMRKHLPSLTARANTHLQKLYELLLRPVEERIGARRLVIVPHRTLHYVPFHALYDGAAYVIERREVCYAPSAIVLRHCLAKPLRFLERALLVGVSDAETPRVRDEIEALAPLFSEAVSLIDAQATLAATQAQAARANVLHFACHGQFRPDSPLFSSLRLADDWLTVREAYQLKLKDCGLVTLSACETGVNAIAPGDELIGLARGFFSAGAPSLVLSLWMVDDEATAALMTIFYQQLRKGEAPAAALRTAQLQILETRQHPFFWSPFVLMGRW